MDYPKEINKIIDDSLIFDKQESFTSNKELLNIFSEKGNLDINLLIKIYSYESLFLYKFDIKEINILLRSLDFLMSDMLKKLLIYISLFYFDISMIEFPNNNIYEMYLLTSKRIGVKSKISCGDGCITAIKKDGSIITWGKIFYFGNPPEGKFKMVSCSSDCNVAISEDNNVYFWNSAVRFSFYSKIIYITSSSTSIMGISQEGTLIILKNHLDIFNFMKDKKGIISIACGYYHIVILQEDGIVITCGGTHINENQDNPTGKFVMVSCGNYHSAGIREDGHVVIWGKYRINNNYVKAFQIIEGNFMMISCGELFTVGIDMRGKVSFWGDIYLDENDREIILSEKFTYVTCGAYHACLIRQDGRLFSIGRSEEQQPFYEYDEVTNIKNISCGRFSSVAVDQKGKLYISGNKDYWQWEGAHLDDEFS